MSGAAWGLVVGLIGAAAWIPGLWGMYDGWRKRKAAKQKALDEGDRFVVDSALKLLKPYEKQVDELGASLAAAKQRGDELESKLREANSQIASLNSKLIDAQTELNNLRLQVKTLSQQLPGDH